MNRPLFLNIPVADVARAKRFFDALGLAFNPKFTGENAACLVLNDRVNVMLLARPMFQSFTTKQVGDPMTSTQHFLTLSFESRDAVDAFHQRAVDAGAVSEHDAEDSGFMYQRGFNDPDGHQWGLFWMDEARMPAAS